MTQTPNIYLIGLGGIGGAYASMAKDQGYDVKIICNEERRQRYSKNGFVINDRPYQFDYFTKPVETVDLLLIAVKANQLEEAIAELWPFVSEKTILISLLNGVSSERILAEKIPLGTILPGFTIKTDGQRQGQTISFTPGGRIVFGHASPATRAQAERAAALLDFASLPYERVDNIEFRQWWKMMTNVGVNQTQALLRVPYSYFRQPHASSIAKLAMSEVILVANQLDIPLETKHLDEVLALVGTFTPENKTSMLQDIEAQRPTEVDIFAGEVIRLGEQFGIPTPVNRLIYHAIRHFEEQW